MRSVHDSTALSLLPRNDRLSRLTQKGSAMNMRTKWLAAAAAVVVIALLLGFLPLGRTASRDEKSAAAIDEVFADVSKPGSPGCALAVAREGKLLYEKGYGLANLEESVSITPQTVFDIGSTSKQFSASSILLLEKQGKLSINDDIRKYVPELPDYGK